MEKRSINPWKWQDSRSYVQAVEVKDSKGTLYVSGQTAIDEFGNSTTADMATQILLSIHNLETVIKLSNYELKNIVRLTIYTTSNIELLENYGILQDWIRANNIQHTTTVVEVKSLFEDLKIELEAIVVK